MPEIDIISELPGIFYRRPSPDEPEFVQEGDCVEAGDTIGLVEIMKQFTQLQTKESGILVSFLVEDGQMLTPGVVVAKLRVE